MSDFIDDPDPQPPVTRADSVPAPENAAPLDPSFDVEPDWEPPFQPASETTMPSEAPAAIETTVPKEEPQSVAPYTSGASFSIGEPSAHEPVATSPWTRHVEESSRRESAVRPIEPISTGISDSATKPIEPVAPPARTHYYPAPEPRTEPERRSRWPLALLAFGSGLMGALLVGGGLLAFGAFDDPTPPVTTTNAVAATVPVQTVVVREVVSEGAGATGAAAVGRKVVPSIVTVEVGSGDATSDFQPFGSGSGVVFSEDGLILTNNHVIEGAATTRVIFQDGRIYEAEIVGSDELTDLAVLRIQAENLTPIEFGSSLNLNIGDRAIAVGNPLGLEGGASLTVGVVSAFDREVNTGDATPLFGMIQTDAPITNGSSGGALVDAEGKLIGITTAIGVSESGAEGIGFATPVEVVRRIVDQIIETGDVTHAFLGVSLTTSFTIQDDGAAVPAGAIVVGFAEGPSAALDAGLEIDDVILSWNGNKVRTINDLINGIRGSLVGDSILLEVDRGGETLEFEVVLGERPEGV